jgi:UDP-hydrolysing UDP-N-acetyl-D-glucosamine 2-epimerase
MRKIFIFTSSRADYGHLFEIIKYLEKTEYADSKLIVGGTHLNDEFGATLKHIENDGFCIDYKIDFAFTGDSALDIALANANATIGAAKIFASEPPDLLVLLGDRVEILALAQAAVIAGIPIAHIHGGEITEGAIDDSIRHAVTKLSSLHFVATKTYQSRVLQLGEPENKVFNFGAPGIDNLKNTRFLSLQEIEQKLEFNLGQKYFLITFHPTTLEKDMEYELFSNLLIVLRDLRETKLLITFPNNDEKNSMFIEKIKYEANTFPNRVCAVRSLGRVHYTNAMRHASAIIGNSSSGIIEAPSFGIPTINIGSRQKGRIKAVSIVDSDGSKRSIKEALRTIACENFQKICSTCENPYGNGLSALQIADELIHHPLTDLTKKHFVDR